jgi:hypothetical protein
MATVAHIPAKWVERVALRPTRLGTQRRQPKGATSPSGAERSAGPRRQARSLDNSKVLPLATSCADWLQLTETPLDKWNKLRQKQAILVGTFEKIVRETEQRIADLEADPEKWSELKAARSLLKLRAREHDRLSQCQSQWVAFHSDCCGTDLAVPVGCNHRLCFLCNSHRLEKNRERVRVLFDRFPHPVFLTLTIPNLKKISKRSFSTFRRRFNTLRGSKRLPHREWMTGGIFAFETTYNNQSDSPSFKTWHLHSHVLLNSAFALSPCKCSHCDRCGKWRRGENCKCGGKTRWTFYRDEYSGEPKREHSASCAFVRLKRRIEFDWLCLTQGQGRTRWRPSDFNYWFEQTWRRAWIGRLAARHEWNCNNRRTVDVRRVTDRKNAALEVLKYATKASYFAHIPEAVNEFMSAVRGARMVQTFGSCYGFKFEDDVNTWAHLECECGKKDFRKTGFLTLRDVFMEPSGKWKPKPEKARGLAVLCRAGPPGATA